MGLTFAGGLGWKSATGFANGTSGGFGTGNGGGGGGAFSDEELAFSLGELSMSQQQGTNDSTYRNVAPSSSSYQHPSSLPIFAPASSASSYQKGDRNEGLSGLDMLGTSVGAGGFVRDGFASLQHQHQLQQRAGSTDRSGGNSSDGFLGVGRPVSKSRSASYSGVLKGRRWDGGRAVVEDDEDDNESGSDIEGEIAGGLVEGGDVFEEEDRIGKFALQPSRLGQAERSTSLPRAPDTTAPSPAQPIFGLGLSGSPAPPEIVNRNRHQGQLPPTGASSGLAPVSRTLPPPSASHSLQSSSASGGYYPFPPTGSGGQPPQQPLQQLHARHLSQPQPGFHMSPSGVGFLPSPQQPQQSPTGGWYGAQPGTGGLPSPIGPPRPGVRQTSFDPKHQPQLQHHQQQQQQRPFAQPPPGVSASSFGLQHAMRPPPLHVQPPQQQQQQQQPGIQQLTTHHPQQQPFVAPQSMHPQAYPPFYPQPPQYNIQQHQRQLSSPLSTASPSGTSSNLLSSPSSSTTTTTTTTAPPPSLTDLGKGLPLSSVPLSTPLYIVEFKAGRTDLFYSPDPSLVLAKGDLVIVEADRGKDLGKIVNDSISIEEVREFQEGQAELMKIQAMAGLAPGGSAGGTGGKSKEITPKRIFHKAQPLDAQ